MDEPRWLEQSTIPVAQWLEESLVWWRLKNLLSKYDEDIQAILVEGEVRGVLVSFDRHEWSFELTTPMSKEIMEAVEVVNGILEIEWLWIRVSGDTLSLWFTAPISALRQKILERWDDTAWIDADFETFTIAGELLDAKEFHDRLLSLLGEDTIESVESPFETWSKRDTIFRFFHNKAGVRLKAWDIKEDWKSVKNAWTSIPTMMRILNNRYAWEYWTLERVAPWTYVYTKPQRDQN